LAYINLHALTSLSPFHLSAIVPIWSGSIQFLHAQSNLNMNVRVDKRIMYSRTERPRYPLEKRLQDQSQRSIGHTEVKNFGLTS